jgi:hypothetical protein
MSNELDSQGIAFRGKMYFSHPLHSDCLWGPPSTLYFPGGEPDHSLPSIVYSRRRESHRKQMHVISPSLLE